MLQPGKIFGFRYFSKQLNHRARNRNSVNLPTVQQDLNLNGKEIVSMSHLFFKDLRQLQFSTRNQMRNKYNLGFNFYKSTLLKSLIWTT